MEDHTNASEKLNLLKYEDLEVSEMRETPDSYGGKM
jgi:hypothetical protein